MSATTARTARANRVSPFGVLAVAHTKAATRDATTVFFTFAFPLVFLLLFGAIFRSSSVEESGRGYIEYIAPGVLTWGVANAAVFGISFALMQWRENDLLRIVAMTPTRLSTVLGSKLVIALTVAVVQTVLFLGVAMIPFFGLEPKGALWQVIPLILLGVTTFFALGAIIGSIARTAESVAAVANVIMLPMAFLSGSFFPLDMMPPWLQQLAHAFPLFHLNDAVGDVITGTSTWAGLGANTAVIAGFGVVFALVAGRVFRWSND